MFKLLLTLCATILFCKAASITDDLTKCDVTNNVCMSTFYETLIQKATDNGIAELDIPPLDPYKLSNWAVTLLGMLKLTIVDGNVKAFKTCKANSLSFDLANHRTTTEFTCDSIIIDGQYKIEKTPALTALLGEIDVHGEGQGNVAVGKVKLTLDTVFEVKRLGNGEIHFEVKTADSSYTYDLMGKMSIAANNLYIGKQEISEVAVNVLNENWQFLAKSFGNVVLDEGLALFYKVANKFFEKVPAKDFITNDLTGFISC